MAPDTALNELRTLVATYLEGSDDAPRAAELLDALATPPVDIPNSDFDSKYVTNVGPRAYDTLVTHKPTGVSVYVESTGNVTNDTATGKAILRKALSRVAATPTPVPTSTTRPSAIFDNHAREMFGCTAAAIDGALAGKGPRDVAMYAMGTLSNAQEYIRRGTYEGAVEWSVADRHANTIRQLINIAKYAIDKAVPR